MEVNDDDGTKGTGFRASQRAGTALANAQIVTNLEQGGKLYWKFNSGRYDITGALTLSGNISASDPIEFPLQDLNNDGRKLDVEAAM
jgi:hypothetical protein